MDQQINVERYDRQIRLWGQHGQNKCSTSKICLINADSLGTEILKGLCLAGIGSFTILDSNKILSEDVDCNLYISPTCIGKNRGEVVKAMVLDLNEEVNGDVFTIETYLPHINQQSESSQTSDFDSLQDNHVNFWKQFHCVIVSGYIYIDQITHLSKICWSLKIPLILCKSIGFYGTMRCQLREHLVIETHPDNLLPDYNLDKPFNDLKEYFESIDLDNYNDKINSYPYLVIVYKHLKLWQKKNNYDDDKLPDCFQQKQEIKKEIDSSLKDILAKKKAKLSSNLENNNSDNIDDLENTQNFAIQFENYLEASKAINTCLLNSTSIPKNLQEIFDNDNVNKTTNGNHNNTFIFWLIIRAIKEFIFNKNYGKLPVSGRIPDMISSSEEYTKLNAIFKKKAKEDVDSIFSILQQNITQNSSLITTTTITQNIIHQSSNGSLYDDVKLLSKNVRNLEIITTNPIFQDNTFNCNNLNEEDEENDHLTIFLCLRGMDLFFSTYGRLPGYQDNQVETDISKLKDCVKQFAGKIINRLKILDQCLYELCRYGGAEIHATSAFLGGCISQEIIKLVTNQYIPINDTLVYNAMTASTKVFKYLETFGGR